MASGLEERDFIKTTDFERLPFALDRHERYLEIGAGGGSIASACETTRCHGSTRGVRRASCQLCETGAS